MNSIEIEESQNYSSYLKWQEEQEQMQEYLEWEEAQQAADENRAAEYEDDMEIATAIGDFGMGPISKWKKMAWEPAHEALEEEDETEGECEATQQLAQIMVDGIFRYDMYWLPETNEVRVEIDSFRDGSPMYYWYPDSMPITKTLASLLGCDEEDLKIEGLAFFGEGRMGVEAEALPYEVECFLKSTWHDYASEKFGVQFNIKTKADEEAVGACGHAEYDGACSAKTCGRHMTNAAFAQRLDEIWRENRPKRHGLDGTQCDCSMCEKEAEDNCVDPYHESVDENRLPTIGECLNLPKRISDALIRNWVARQPDENKSCAEKEASELGRRRDIIARYL